MKRAPSPRPDWISICSIEHGSGNVIDFPVIDDITALSTAAHNAGAKVVAWDAR